MNPMTTHQPTGGAPATSRVTATATAAATAPPPGNNTTTPAPAGMVPGHPAPVDAVPVPNSAMMGHPTPASTVAALSLPVPVGYAPATAPPPHSAGAQHDGMRILASQVPTTTMDAQQQQQQHQQQRMQQQQQQQQQHQQQRMQQQQQHQHQQQRMQQQQQQHSHATRASPAAMGVQVSAVPTQPMPDLTVEVGPPLHDDMLERAEGPLPPDETGPFSIQFDYNNVQPEIHPTVKNPAPALGERQPALVGVADSAFLSMARLFELMLPSQWMQDVLLPLSNKRNPSLNLHMGELLQFVGLWLTIASHPGRDLHEFWAPARASNARDGDAGGFLAVPSLAHLMTEARFRQIMDSLTLASDSDLQRDRMSGVRNMMMAFNANMAAHFAPSSISDVDTARSLWVYPTHATWPCSAPGYRSPHRFGNTYHALGCTLTRIVYALELEEAIPRPPTTPPPAFSDAGKVAGLLLRLTRSIWRTNKMVVVGSDMATVQAIAALAEVGVHGTCAVTKRGGSWPQHLAAAADALTRVLSSQPTGAAVAVHGTAARTHASATSDAGATSSSAAAASSSAATVIAARGGEKMGMSIPLMVAGFNEPTHVSIALSTWISLARTGTYHTRTAPPTSTPTQQQQQQQQQPLLGTPGGTTASSSSTTPPPTSSSSAAAPPSSATGATPSGSAATTTGAVGDASTAGSTVTLKFPEAFDTIQAARFIVDRNSALRAHVMPLETALPFKSWDLGQFAFMLGVVEVNTFLAFNHFKRGSRELGPLSRTHFRGELIRQLVHNHLLHEDLPAVGGSGSAFHAAGRRGKRTAAATAAATAASGIGGNVAASSMPAGTGAVDTSPTAPGGGDVGGLDSNGGPARKRAATGAVKAPPPASMLVGGDHRLLTAPTYSGKFVLGQWTKVATKYNQHKCTGIGCTRKIRTYCSCDPTSFLCARCFVVHFSQSRALSQQRLQSDTDVPQRHHEHHEQHEQQHQGQQPQQQHEQHEQHEQQQQQQQQGEQEIVLPPTQTDEAMLAGATQQREQHTNSGGGDNSDQQQQRHHEQHQEREAEQQQQHQQQQLEDEGGSKLAGSAATGNGAGGKQSDKKQQAQS
ncbi:hypothetical protein PTSG_12685 [Salpingoeca rosetta]|uniref:PiggyBac transposable element-derived protein domain-containing protein n=1 Tax=Salpingoeca rosetta (strain ATCC 50818 / BSB-021) TaxID=946362 RepID=F2UI34_SALR5|nr:uncharacterized protein PTSG_12685 [Salpingoeca rosetta]EGD76783.1 hypothetical protein PTSG_12685 [Salpingoeca rosetta]|eukprot:XP_004991155.1 hypothetical protein PTSG_12685 [Salpingoeca rosetta]